VIVIGAGEVGHHVARTLSAERHDVTIVDHDPARVESIQRELDALAVLGNGASPRFLRDLDAGAADLVCSVTQSDEVNVIAALAAHQLGAQRTVARVRDPDYFGTDEAFARDVLGIDFIIHPERATADDLAEALLLPGAVHVEHFGAGSVAVAETIITHRSPLPGQALQQRRMVRPHTVMGLIRDGRAIAAEPGHRPKVGDHILIAAAHADIGRVVAHLAGHAVSVENVVVFGGGHIGLPLTRRLEAAGRFRVTVMERDAERARYVAERVRRAIVLHEENMGKDVLLTHGVDRLTAFVAATNDDRANLLSALNAKQVGAELALAVVSGDEYTPLVDALGIDAGFSPRLVTAEAILRAARGTSVEAVHLLLGGAEVLEVQVDARSYADGRRLTDANVRGHTHVSAIVREGRVLIPDGDAHIRAGDRLVLFNARRGVCDVAGAFKAA
jgi:trk system potassium uptake protein TrkA